MTYAERKSSGARRENRAFSPRPPVSDPPQITETGTEARLDPRLQDRTQRCRTILASLESAVVAFSGGVDSTLLLGLAAQTLGPQRVAAAIGVSPALPHRELLAARSLAALIGVQLFEIPTQELARSEYRANPVNRCYYCKRELFRHLKRLAEQKGYDAVLSGANADDRGDFRPGLTAAKEFGIITPLLEAGLTKADVRAVSRAMDLPTWNKPAMACLSSRVPYGQTIAPAVLSRIEHAEYVLKDLGFAQVRVRDHGDVGRIEVPQADIARLIEFRKRILGALKSLGYTYIALDLQGFRSGSMNEVLDSDAT